MVVLAVLGRGARSPPPRVAGGWANGVGLVEGWPRGSASSKSQRRPANIYYVEIRHCAQAPAKGDVFPAHRLGGEGNGNARIPQRAQSNRIPMGRSGLGRLQGA